jgi:heat shock protein HslJ
MAEEKREQVDGSWRLVEIDGEPVVPDSPGEIRFGDGQVSGRVGVNRFNGSYTLTGTRSSSARQRPLAWPAPPS